MKLSTKIPKITGQFTHLYTDCFAMDSTLKFSASIITGDPEFESNGVTS